MKDFVKLELLTSGKAEGTPNSFSRNHVSRFQNFVAQNFVAFLGARILLLMTH